MPCLDKFVEHPTAAQIHNCRKDDLVEIATHFNIPFFRAMLKKEIKEWVISGLVEQGVIILTEQLESAPFSFADDKEKEKEDEAGGKAPSTDRELPLAGGAAFPVNRAGLSQMQKADPTLQECFGRVVSNNKARDEKVAYVMDGEVLIRKWSSSVTGNTDCDSVYQIVVPAECRQQVMSVAHESMWSGHLGITKTYRAILQHFYWPGLKSDISKYCRTCHVCQVVRKPNQIVPPAPLHPIPVMAEPFEQVVIDCVGPLPRTKSGNQYLLTIMC